MISWSDLYVVLTAVVPLYVAMILAYGSVRWWKIFSPDQCSGINRFVAIFAVPLLSFHFISTNNPYKMDFHFIAADTLQKVIMLVALSLWARVSRAGSLEWAITIFSLSTLPNTLVMGIPLLKAMYRGFSEDAGSLMVQVVVLQCIIWYTLLLFLFEYRGAKMLIMEQFPETAASIVSFKVDSDVVSLDGRDFLETEAEVGDDGKLHVTVRKSNASRRSFAGGGSGLTPRPSNLTGAEIYSLSSSRNPTPRGSNFNTSDFYGMMGGVQGFPGGRLSNFGPADLYSVQSSRGPTPRLSNFEENCVSPTFGLYPVHGSYPAPNPEFSGTVVGGNVVKTAKNIHYPPQQQQGNNTANNTNNKAGNDVKELHMFVWSSSTSPASEVSGGLQVFGGSGGPEFGASELSGCSEQGAKEIRMFVADHPQNGESKVILQRGDFAAHEDFTFGGKGEDDHEDSNDPDKDGPIGLNKLGSSSTAELHPKVAGSADADGMKQMPPASVMTRLILIMVWRKLIRNPNTYSSLIGLIWSLVCFRWHVAMPKIIEKSISILSDAGLGMAMFSLGGRIFHGLPIFDRTSSHGRGFHRRWSPGDSPPHCHCSGRITSRNCPIRVCQGVQCPSCNSKYRGYIRNVDSPSNHPSLLHSSWIMILAKKMELDREEKKHVSYKNSLLLQRINQKGSKILGEAEILIFLTYSDGHEFRDNANFPRSNYEESNCCEDQRIY